MENASKALIIAGAILLSILLISLGIMIFTQAQDVVTGSGMTEAQISAFNDKFVKYEGKRKGTMVKSLIQDVLATNSSSGDNDDIKVYVAAKGTNAPTDWTHTGGAEGESNNGTEKPKTNQIVNNNTYTVTLEYTGKENRVSVITIDGVWKAAS